jgi:hypothetical protein
MAQEPTKEVLRYVYETPLEDLILLKLTESYPPEFSYLLTKNLDSHIKDLLHFSLLKYLRDASSNDLDLQNRLGISNKDFKEILERLEEGL